MKQIDIVVYGEPVAQGRPKFVKATGRAYDPAKSRDYKDYVKLAAAGHMNGKPPLTGPLALTIRVYRSMPKGLSKKKAALAEAGVLRPVTKPDLDNYVKGIKDALKGLCWIDDSRVVEYREPFGKFYSATPRIEIVVTQLEDEINSENTD